MRRHDEVAFMGGAHVFPGGRVDSADRLVSAESLCDGVAAAVSRIPAMPAAEAVAHHVAAVRELLEEAGVLLASRDGEPIVLRDEAERARFLAYRRALGRGTLTVRELAERERLRLRLDALTMFAHWVTPEIEIKRYDVRFFIALAPQGQEAVHDDAETISAVWVDPTEAVERCLSGQLALPPPTWTTLRTLEAFESVGEVLEWARHRRGHRVQPHFTKGPDTSMLTLPGDPLYPAASDFEPFRETRFVLDGGRWRPVPANSSGMPRS